MGKITTLLVFALTLTRAFAQQAALTDTLVEDEIRRYKVEVIVFTYEEDVSIGSEVFLPDEPPAIEEPLLDEDGYPRDLEALPFADDARRVDQPFEEAPAWTVDLGVDDGERRQIADVRAARDLRIELLGDDELELVREIRQLELLDAYRTIMHVGWIQPTYPQEVTPAIELRLLANPPQGLDGSFTLYLSRYLHLVVDLALAAPSQFEAAPLYEPPPISFGDSRAQYGEAYALNRQPVRYRIRENRIVKNGELRYFDHPKFGVLAKISRVAEEEEVVVIPLIGSGRQ